MSGAEVIVGLVLGVLPLIIKAAESYKKIGEVIATYRKYSKAVHIFSIELSTQKTIFQNECTLILAEVVDNPVPLNEMFSQPAGAVDSIRLSLRNNRNMDQLSERMIGRILDSYKQLEVLLELIAQNLEQIYENIQQYQSSRPDVSAHSACQARYSLKLTALLDLIEKINQLQNLGTQPSSEISLLNGDNGTPGQDWTLG